MPDLTNTIRWVEYEPDLLGNRASPSPFYFLMNGSMSKLQMQALNDAMSQRLSSPELPADATDEQREAHAEAQRVALVDRNAKALEPFIRLGEEPLLFEADKPVKTIRDYLDAASRLFHGLEAFMEPYKALLKLNTLGPDSSFFSGRLSGGFTSTASRRNGKGGGRTVAH